MVEPPDNQSDGPPPSGPWREPIPDGLGQDSAGVSRRRTAKHQPQNFVPPSADYFPTLKQTPPPPLPKAPKLSRRQRNHQRPLAPTWEPDPLSAYGTPQFQQQAPAQPPGPGQYQPPPAPGQYEQPMQFQQQAPAQPPGPGQYQPPAAPGQYEQPMQYQLPAKPVAPQHNYYVPPPMQVGVGRPSVEPGLASPPQADGFSPSVSNEPTHETLISAPRAQSQPFDAPTPRIEVAPPAEGAPLTSPEAAPAPFIPTPHPLPIPQRPPVQPTAVPPRAPISTPPPAFPRADWNAPATSAHGHTAHVPVATPFTTAQPEVPAYDQAPQHRSQGPSVDQLGLIRSAKPLPKSGWRKVVHRLSGGAINPGESSEETTRTALIERINAPVRGDYRIAVLSLKGGVGKTTTTFSLGATFASLRGDRVIAVDANPDFGTLAQRGPDETRSTVRDLLIDNDIHRYSDVRRHTSQSASRLEVLASERDPAASELFSEADYRAVMRILQRFYNIILTDCGTGLMHSAMAGVLDEANAIVLVTSPAIDGARSALATLDWLDHHGYSHLVRQSVVVISSSRPGASSVDLEQLSRHFLTRARAVHVVPFDNHLSEGSEISLDLMSRKTRMAFTELAAAVADGFQYGGREPHRRWN
ncbi:MinD/ParA family ATP-binding protein [Mycobacteroides chelonae]|uniref:MinD/ParA family ATP-binding protein n=1 Tax=Mycobacteroides chelonae TaxID=1774 RepID=UPI0008A97158|nr:MinD/ParA family protein [Mycobacteroides chelonae]AYM40727.1 MinD/ParA family protein [[Mycobacterium] chelonae subsp. gwanakae]OHU16306.1 secretion protein EspI [Mycobacteroides chelonae]